MIDSSLLEEREERYPHRKPSSVGRFTRASAEPSGHSAWAAQDGDLEASLQQADEIGRERAPCLFAANRLCSPLQAARFMGVLMIIVRGALFGFRLSFWAMLAGIAVRVFY